MCHQFRHNVAVFLNAILLFLFLVLDAEIANAMCGHIPIMKTCWEESRKSPLSINVIGYLFHSKKPQLKMHL